MRDPVSEPVLDLLGVVGSALGAAAVSLVGVLAEGAGIRALLAGQTVVGAWELWMGSALLFVGVYLLGYRECWSRLQRLRRTG